MTNPPNQFGPHDAANAIASPAHAGEAGEAPHTPPGGQSAAHLQAIDPERPFSHLFEEDQAFTIHGPISDNSSDREAYDFGNAKMLDLRQAGDFLQRVLPSGRKGVVLAARRTDAGDFRVLRFNKEKRTYQEFNTGHRKPEWYGCIITHEDGPFLRGYLKDPQRDGAFERIAQTAKPFARFFNGARTFTILGPVCIGDLLPEAYEFGALPALDILKALTFIQRDQRHVVLAARRTTLNDEHRVFRFHPETGWQEFQTGKLQPTWFASAPTLEDGPFLRGYLHGHVSAGTGEILSELDEVLGLNRPLTPFEGLMNDKVAQLRIGAGSGSAYIFKGGETPLGLSQTIRHLKQAAEGGKEECVVLAARYDQHGHLIFRYLKETDSFQARYTAPLDATHDEWIDLRISDVHGPFLPGQRVMLYVEFNAKPERSMWNTPASGEPIPEAEIDPTVTPEQVAEAIAEEANRLKAFGEADTKRLIEAFCSDIATAFDAGAKAVRKFSQLQMHETSDGVSARPLRARRGGRQQEREGILFNMPTQFRVDIGGELVNSDENTSYHDGLELPTVMVDIEVEPSVVASGALDAETRFRKAIKTLLANDGKELKQAIEDRLEQIMRDQP